ncbi:TetR/AcrR family transcriptional regulator [Streptomyces rapamycinicus]|uniref:TetR family transcriptional regulator n=2 Tax=Streptomyces rapamycinicus TaxID=1226757 RepID=A0A0A0NL03_STRRN|nr:TetR/AcrR family transcriptional regulator [Streptomyces rapamycinicus]AGP55055.1 TetR family transcriptional regulator [Streptomyces rapamycinicus NRRL 5491]MBB4782587.1 TetR/AcrR family transcriptional repressor of mexJK operon [Streptomyces rapamycinicus]RLV81931.1 TetR family transcriptional regulator [Streptomyces rapamycinicus NRRL 5491]UTO63082.1 TetR/AcrR family transcriptional regulator [Streptomyces rapamycinicus]UTP31041.1 TetR/AcrR family transcriptional regulator [Streptomyces 
MRTDSGPRRGAAGRPVGPQPAKRQAILEAAVAVFLREGYDRASVDAIADEARVSKQTVYNHFGDKERLFIAAVEEERERVAAGFAAGSPHALGPDGAGAPETYDSGDARTALLAFGHRVLAVLLDARASALRRLVIAEVARHPSLRPACAEGEPQQLVEYLAEMLGRRTGSGELSVPEPATAARQFVALIIQQGLYQSMYGTRPLTEDEATAVCESAADLLVRAYRP